MPETVPLLTPAQLAFVEREIPGFRVDRWQVGIAGSAGSDRRFIRLVPPNGRVPDDSRVLVVWDSSDNDWPRFLGIADEMGGRVDSLPRLYAHDPDHGLILEQDAGETTLHSHCLTLSSGAPELEASYRRVVDALVAWQQVPPSECPTIDSRAMDEEMFLWETDYFAEHCVTEYFGCEEALDQCWEQERERLALDASRLPQVCIHRDFQSENIVVEHDRVYFVDFQGARRGPAYYDLASLLLDPYVDVIDDALAERLYGYFAEQTRTDNLRAYLVCAAQRLMQALGAYANLSLHRGKDRYRAFIPRALQRLEAVLRSCDSYPALLKAVIVCRDSSRGRHS